MKKVFSGGMTILVAMVLMLGMVNPVQASNGTYLPDEPPIDETPQSAATQDVVTEPRAADANALLLANPVITIWYEAFLKFGVRGNPQDQINILGNVVDDGSVSSLSYRLNGGASIALSLGPNSTRLARAGDFNAAIPIVNLVEGTNTVVFTARDNSGGTTTKTVTFPFFRNRSWPMPYNTNWGAASIPDQAEVVDGVWDRVGDSIRVGQQGYDRLIAIGDMNWMNYEVLVPITIHAFYPVGTDAGGVGIITKWQGHYGSGQPPTSWDRIGAYGYYSNRQGALALRLTSASPATENFPFQYNRTYMFKLRAETIGADGRYSFKVWDSSQPEPAGWQFTNVVDANDALTKGSVLLVAHRADATFGNVSIYPIGSQPPPPPPTYRSYLPAVRK